MASNRSAKYMPGRTGIRQGIAVCQHIEGWRSEAGNVLRLVVMCDMPWSFCEDCVGPTEGLEDGIPRRLSRHSSCLRSFVILGWRSGTQAPAIAGIILSTFGFPVASLFLLCVLSF